LPPTTADQGFADSLNEQQQIGCTKSQKEGNARAAGMGSSAEAENQPILHMVSSVCDYLVHRGNFLLE
jgi:hypothetical protein